MENEKQPQYPWKVGAIELQDCHENEPALVIYDSSKPRLPDGYREMICAISPVNSLNDQDLENAKLLVLAPKMLDVIKGQISFLQSLLEGDDDEFIVSTAVRSKLAKRIRVLRDLIVDINKIDLSAELDQYKKGV